MPQTRRAFFAALGLVVFASTANGCSSSAVPSVGPPAGERPNGPPSLEEAGTAAGPVITKASTEGIIVAFYEEARAAGRDVLTAGGSASDAFVAVTLVDYVRAAGETSLGGPLGALTYDAKTGKVRSLDAGFDAVHDPRGLYDPDAPKNGATALVPGALRGLEAIWRHKGRLPWARVVQPAIDLARAGFAADAIFAASVASRVEVLERSAYAKALYLPGGTPIKVGTIVKQPEVASLLEDVAAGGADAMYQGAWASEFVTKVNAQGGFAAITDVSGYEAKWTDPWQLDVAGKHVFSNSGRSYGGVYGLLGLSVLAHDTRKLSALSEADRIEVGLRTARVVYEDPWFMEASSLDNGSLVRDRLASTDDLWADVLAKKPAKPYAGRGSHSLHVTVVDRDGDAVTGTNTLNSLPWGSGIFVRGVSLTDAGSVTGFVPGPGERVLNALSLHAVTEGDRLTFIGGTFGSSLLEIELQVLAEAVLDDSITAKEIESRHRFGTFLYDDASATVDLTGNWVDDGTPDGALGALRGTGLKVERTPDKTLGWGTFVLREPSGAYVGAVLDMTWFPGGIADLGAPKKP